MKILLVAAALEGDFSPSADKTGMWVGEVLPELFPKAFMPPLDLATIAGLTPDEHEVVLYDERTQGILMEDSFAAEHFDLVGVSGYQNHLPRAAKIGDLFRRRGVLTVIGGSGITQEPDRCRDHFDVVFLGEAELTWPRFLEDLAQGSYESEYREVSFVDLAVSPRPDWGTLEGLLASGYTSGGVQVNRGCPHRCEFCNIWVVFGRKMRTKPIPQVLDEIRELKRLGMDRVMFCSDNFVGNPRYAKSLLREVIELNRSWEDPVRFFTELTMLIARDEEMLTLLSEANFPGVFIGIETPSEDSLAETGKEFNLAGGLVTQCHRIASHGLYIAGSFIVGFDSDTPAIFERQASFIQEALLPVPRLNVLYAGRGTALRERLMAEDRIIDIDKSFAAVSSAVPGDSFVTNVVPKGMTRVELYTGYLELVSKVWQWETFEERVIGFLDSVERVPDRPASQSLTRRALQLRGSYELLPTADVDAIRNIYMRAERLSPRFLPVVAELIALFLFELDRLPVLIEDLERHIELELAVERASSLELKPADSKGRTLRPAAPSPLVAFRGASAEG